MPAPRKPLTEEFRARLQDMVRRGLSRKQMAAALSVNRHIIDRAMRNENLRSTGTSGRPAQAPSTAHPGRVPIGTKTTLPPLPSLSTDKPEE